MSRYLTALVSKEITIQQINSVGNKYNLSFVPIKNNSSINKVLKKSMHYYLIEWKEDKYNIATETQSEINDALNLFQCIGKTNHDVALILDNEISKKELVRNIYYRNWKQFLSEFLLENYKSEIGLLLHWYGGVIENEKVVIRNIIETPVSATNTFCVFMPMEEDVLYLYSAKQDTT